MTIERLLEYASFGCALSRIEDGDYEDIQDYKHKIHDYYDKEVEDIIHIDFKEINDNTADLVNVVHIWITK